LKERNSGKLRRSSGKPNRPPNRPGGQLNGPGEHLHIQWFPGHMAKTRRMIRENLRLVDLVAELRDARVPYASANPEIKKLLGSKKRIIILNKSDMADPAATKAWLEHFEKQQIAALAMDCRSGKGVGRFVPAVEKLLLEELTRRRTKGMVGRPLRVMVVGVPNVGKSSFINRMASSKRTKVEDRPGVTRGKQWVKLSDGMELLDMPGVLWPKFEDPVVGEHLAFTGAVRDQIMDTEALASRLLERLAVHYPALLVARYSLSSEEMAQQPGHVLLSLIGQKRGMLLPGGEINTERASIAVLDEFRGGQIGKITLELPKAEA
jgi:ribosome biogenesis GTPase A